jgi:hypothetical protein
MRRAIRIIRVCVDLPLPFLPPVAFNAHTLSFTRTRLEVCGVVARPQQCVVWGQAPGDRIDIDRSMEGGEERREGDGRGWPND